MNNSTQSATSNNKPVVILAGWLGCRPRNLRRFIELYDRIGWDSIIRIGSPRSVIAAMTEGPNSKPSQSEMKHLAINTLREIQTMQPPHFIIHVFSNNGCFLWEWMRSLLLEQASALSSADDSSIDLFHNLRQKLFGIIFDSGPAHYDGKTASLLSALQFVSPESERNILLGTAQSLDDNVVKKRFDEFWSGLCNDSTGIPQMYMYSQCDLLAPMMQLEKLIAHREKILRRDVVIRKHMFLDSEHCCHLLKYPEEYEVLVKQFLSLCTKKCDDNQFSRRSRL